MYSSLPELVFRSRAPARELEMQPRCKRSYGWSLRIGLEKSSLVFESRLSLLVEQACRQSSQKANPSCEEGRIPCCQTLCPRPLLCLGLSSSQCKSCSSRSRKGLLRARRSGQRKPERSLRPLVRSFRRHYRGRCALWCILRESCLKEYRLITSLILTKLSRDTRQEKTN